MPCAVEVVTIQQPAHEDVGMRIRRVGVQDTGNTRTGSGRHGKAAPAGDREQISACQNAIFNPNWNCRDVLAWRVTWPNCADVTEPFGAANCGVLSRL